MTGSIVFTGGGTGGHIFPALAVLEELSKNWHGRIVWIGSFSGMEKSILKKRKIPYYGIPTGKLRRYLSFQNISDIFRIFGGIMVSFFIFFKEKPSLIFSKGGYVTVPPVFAASVLGIPVFTHESDLDPGLATRINARFAEKILISFNETVSFFKKNIHHKIIHTGNPIRTGLLKGDPDLGRKIVGCPEDLPMLLVLGGSQGSVFINSLIIQALGELTKTCFVVHQMGPINYKDNRHAKYFAAPFFTEELPHLMAAADLVVCRSGANTLWELAALGKPSILIPLSQAASRGDQIKNAEFFAQNKAAILIYEQDVTSRMLLKNVRDLLDNKNSLEKMSERVQSLSLPDSASRIAELLRKRSMIR